MSREVRQASTRVEQIYKGDLKTGAILGSKVGNFAAVEKAWIEAYESRELLLPGPVNFTEELRQLGMLHYASGLAKAELVAYQQSL